MAAVSAVSRLWAMTDSNGWFDPKQRFPFPRVGSKANREPFPIAVLDCAKISPGFLVLFGLTPAKA